MLVIEDSCWPWMRIGHDILDSVWVGVLQAGMPLGYLSNAWAMQALRHVGFIDSMPDELWIFPGS